MSVQYKHRAVDGTISDITQQVRFPSADDQGGTDGLVTNAEEASVGRSRMLVDDPSGTFDIVGHRKVYAVETAATSDDYAGVWWVGYTNIQTIREASPFDGTGRMWELDLDDLNTVLDRRLIRDSGSDRPAETDIERLAWLMGLGEMGLIDSDAYVDDSNPVDMDADDLTNTRIHDAIDSLAQQSGNNWFVINLKQTPDENGDPNLYALWYGKGEPDILVSEIRISNDPADFTDEDCFAPAKGTTLKRDPTRIYSEAVIEYEGGDSFVTVDAIEEANALGHRDTTIPAPDLKTSAKAVTRGLRQLNENATQEEVVESAIIVPAARVNCLVAGMRVPIKLTWAPGFTDFRDARVLNRTVKPLAPGLYEIGFEAALAAVSVPSPIVVGPVILEIGSEGFGGITISHTGDQHWASDLGVGPYPLVVGKQYRLVATVLDGIDLTELTYAGGACNLTPRHYDSMDGSSYNLNAGEGSTDRVTDPTYGWTPGSGTSPLGEYEGASFTFNPLTPGADYLCGHPYYSPGSAFSGDWLTFDGPAVDADISIQATGISGFYGYWWRVSLELQERDAP